MRRMLRPVAYRGIGLNTSGRVCFLDYDGGGFDTPRREALSVERLNAFPSFDRVQPQGKVFPLQVRILVRDSQAQFEALSKIFDPQLGENTLLLEDCGLAAGGRVYRVACVPQQIVHEQRSERPVVVPLWAANPILEDNTQTSAGKTIGAAFDGSPAVTLPVRNLGTHDALPTFEIIPRQKRTAAQAFTRMMEVGYANRSEFALTGPGSGTWMLMIKSGWDTATLVSGGAMESDGRDIAVFVDEVELPRERVRLSAMNTAATKVWIDLYDAPARFATFETAIAAGSTTFTFTSAEHGFRPGDYLIWLNNAAAYEQAKVLTVDGKTVTVARGRRNTTAGASAIGLTVYRSGHHIQIAWGRTGMAARPADPDPPLINLSTSTNLLWEWTTAPIWPEANRRPGGWRRVLYDGREDMPELVRNRLSAKTTLDITGASIRFSDLEPTAAQPNYDAVEFRACCGIDDVLGAIEYDASLGWPFCLQVIGRDLLGLDTVIFNRLGHEVAAAHAPPYPYINRQETPPAVLSGVIFRARQSVLTTCRPADTVPEELSPILTSGHDLQGFRIDEDAQLVGIVARAKHGTAGTTGLEMQINAVESAGEPGARLAGPFSGFGAMGAAYIHVCTFPSPAAAFTTDVPVLAAGDYFLSIAETSGGTGAIQVPRSNASIYARGSHWEHDGTAFVEFPDEDLWFALLSVTADNQEDAILSERTGEVLTMDDIKLTFDPARTPIIDPRAEEDAYYFQDQFSRGSDLLELRYLKRWAEAQNNQITIDVVARTVTDVQLVEDVRQAVTADGEPWVSLPAGNQTVSITAVGGAVQEAHVMRFRSAWQA